MTDFARPICLLCANYAGDVDEFDVGLFCLAFPPPGKGIPAAILEGRADHRLPFSGDHGIRFERRKGVRERQVEDEFGAPGAIGA